MKLLIRQLAILSASCLAALTTTTIQAQPAAKQIDLKHCKDAVGVMQSGGKKPTMIVALDDNANLVSALFLHKAEKECYLALPYKPETPLQFKSPVNMLNRVQPFVYIQHPGSACHFIGYDSSGNAIWYCHAH